ncbi:LegC family aminotransferase [Oceanimonas sp. CAM02]|uniref:LegC family aminotransferase n=1 Tax=Oceanimonas sp. CAM02 TaxID=3080336 RepID=UPI002936524E|nr:LegC family aminotransferase [Oceanimonas sp. CAM02]MDV2857689.1 LegC family aminotransferase [Oceanimonas sp. CAM02]
MQATIDFIRSAFNSQEFIPLHEPRFNGNEKKYLNECIDSTFVSSVGKFVEQFEQMFADYVGAKYAIAAMNGTAALHIALLLADVEQDTEVITQPLTFIATANAISYCGAQPVFVDVDKDTLGLSPQALREFLQQQAKVENGQCINQTTGKVIKACLPMHTFGHPCRIDEITAICAQWHISVVEDAAESLGSYYQGQHTGTFGKVGAFSFNGNKVITSGGGGVIVTNDEALAKQAKHITTTAKVPHPYEYVHDQIGYNYRMTNLNAALLVAQMEQLDSFLAAKRRLAEEYQAFFSKKNMHWVAEPSNSQANYWLQTVILNSQAERDCFLKATNAQGVMTRPIWRLMNELEMFKHCQHGSLSNAKWLEQRAVNIPSSVRL